MTSNRITNPDRALMEAEAAAIAVTRLFEEAILPLCTDFTCVGLLDVKSEHYGGDRGAAALAWMEANFDAISSTCYAASILAEKVADILQLLPRVQTPTCRSGDADED